MKEVLHDSARLLRRRDVRLLLGCTGLSVAGDAMALVALLLRVHDGGGGPYAVTALLVCFAAPVVATLGIAGAVADRCDSRTVILWSGVAQSGAALGLVWVRTLPATCVLVLALQTGFAFGSPVWSALQPLIAGDPADTGRLVAATTAVRALAGPAGSGLGGALVGVAGGIDGSGWALVIDAASFGVLTLGGLLLRARRQLGPAGRGRSRSPAGALVPRDGVEALRQAPVVAALVAALLPFIVTLEAINAVEVFLVRDVLHASAAQFGLAETAAGAGAVTGSLGAGLLTGRRRRVRAITGSLTGIGLAQAGMGLAPGYPAYLLGAFVVGLLLGAGNALILALLLEEVPEPGRGAALALVGGLSRGCGLLALLLGGTLATTLGPRGAYVAVGAAGVVVAVWARWRVRAVAGLEPEGLRPA